MKMLLLFVVSFLFIVSQCTSDRNNPLDILGDEYVKPSFTIDWDNSTVAQNGTLTIDSMVIVCKGNTPTNEFSYCIDTGPWSTWSASNVILSKLIDDGLRKVTIKTRYPQGSEVFQDSVTFTASILANKAVYITPRVQYVSSGVRPVITVCTKGIASTYMMHLALSGCTIVADSILYTDSPNVNAFSSDTVIDISVLDSTYAIAGDQKVVRIALAPVTTSQAITLSCNLTDKNNNAVLVSLVRGAQVVLSTKDSQSE